MTKFTDCSREKKDKEFKETVFTHSLNIHKGWVENRTKVSDEHIKEIKYMGKCITDGDLFMVYFQKGTIFQYKGIKGDEEYT